jgi:hypothetical protein
VTNTFMTATGPITSVADQSIQLGDGGVGVVFDMQAYKAVKFMTFFAGARIWSTRETLTACRRDAVAPPRRLCRWRTSTRRASAWRFQRPRFAG